VLVLSAFAKNIEYKISYPHGLFKFALTVGGSSHESQTLYKLADEKKFFSSIDQNDLKDLQEAIYFLEKSYPVEIGNNISQNLMDLYTIRSIQSIDLNDFFERAIGILPLQIEKRFFDILKKIEPFYKKEIWNSSMSPLLSIRRSFDRSSEELNLEQFFNTMKIFYGSVWPSSQKFYVGLHPIPGKDGHTTAQSIGIVESVGLLTQETDLHGRFGVIIHEMAHSIYREQTVETIENWKTWLESTNSKYTRVFKANVNEAIATAIGNGYVYEKLSGIIDMTPWYNDDVIEPIARTIYPLVKEYLNQNKAVDLQFFKKSLAKIEKEVPFIDKAYSSYFKQIAVVSELKDTTPPKLRSILRQNFHSNSIYGHGSISKEFLKNITKYKNEAHSLMLISKGKSSFKKMNSFLEKKDKIKFQKYLKNKEKTFSLVDAKGNGYFFFAVKNENDFETELVKLKDQKYIK